MFDLISRVRSWTVGDGAPALAALSSEAWALVASIGDEAAAQALAYETAAGRFRAVSLFVRHAQTKRGGSPEEQAAAFEGLRAAVLEAKAGAPSFDETLDKFRLALTSTPGQES